MEEVRRGETGKKRRKRLDKGGGRNIEKQRQKGRTKEKGGRWEKERQESRDKTRKGKECGER